MNNDLSRKSDFLFYNSEDGNITVQVIVGEDTVWTTQKGMAEIFSVEVPAISKHVGNIIEEGELNTSTISKMEIVQKEGSRDVKRTVEFYSLDMIIAVGYRVNSYNATKFRIWATKVLREYLIKGFAMDDERLKQGNNLFNQDYFKELLERIREIRSSEKMFYEQVRDLFATSVDYDKKSNEAINFFATIQNKLEYAVTGHTAAELIKNRANSELPNMNLKTWKNVKKGGEIQKTDVTVAKNYLTETELKPLRLLVTMFLDFAELQAQRNSLMKMSDWIERVDSFLKFNDYKVLTNAGSIRKEVADNFAKGEYEKYKIIQNRNALAFKSSVRHILETGKLPSEVKEDTTSEFDKHLKGLLSVPPPKKEK
jgi:hypothetical protein